MSINYAVYELVQAFKGYLEYGAVDEVNGPSWADLFWSWMVNGSLDGPFDASGEFRQGVYRPADVCPSFQVWLKVFIQSYADFQAGEIRPDLGKINFWDKEGELVRFSSYGEIPLCSAGQQWSGTAHPVFNEDNFHAHQTRYSDWASPKHVREGASAAKRADSATHNGRPATTNHE